MTIFFSFWQRQKKTYFISCFTWNLFDYQVLHLYLVCTTFFNMFRIFHAKLRILEIPGHTYMLKQFYNWDMNLRPVNKTTIPSISQIVIRMTDKFYMIFNLKRMLDAKRWLCKHKNMFVLSSARATKSSSQGRLFTYTRAVQQKNKNVAEISHFISYVGTGHKKYIWTHLNIL